MRIFFDTEFIENGNRHPIIPISIGLVREDEESLYIEFAGVDWSKANTWVLENVKPHLKAHKDNPAVPKDEAREYIKDFVGEKPEFWAYYADYDWVVLCQLYGAMIDRPEGWPMYCLDIKQFMWHFNISKEDLNGIDNGQEHNALEDARWNLKVFRKLLELKEAQGL